MAAALINLFDQTQFIESSEDPEKAKINYVKALINHAAQTLHDMGKSDVRLSWLLEDMSELLDRFDEGLAEEYYLATCPD